MRAKKILKSKLDWLYWTGLLLVQLMQGGLLKSFGKF